MTTDPAINPMTDDEQLEPIGYAEALAELELILRDLEDGEVDIDHLAGQVRRAATLVRHCRGRLADAHTEVTRIVADLDGEIGLDQADPADPQIAVDQP